MRLSTPPSGYCRCGRPATAGTSVASPPRCTWTPGSPRSSSTTALRAVPVSPNGATSAPSGGWPRRATPSRRATARPAARPACSPRNAATATSRWTSAPPCGCSRSSWGRARGDLFPDLGYTACTRQEAPMTALGLAIMIVAGAVTLDVILENTRNTDASVVGQTISNVDLGGFFTAGVLVGIAGMIGLMLLLAGLARARRRRLERKELTRSYEGTAAHAETLQEERDRLAAELEQERSARSRAERSAAAPATSAATGRGTTAAGPTGPGADDRSVANDSAPMRAEADGSTATAAPAGR